MATIYKIELVSHWLNYPPEEVKKIIEDAFKKAEDNPRSEITANVERKR